jgi:phenylalanyl-tRNA synthetase beta chain
MKFTLGWLKDHLKTDASLEEITSTLTVIGLEVEEVLDPAGKFAPYLAGYVISAEKHPNADKLKVCKVDIGNGDPIQVVCGAPNARTGMTGVFAPVGTYVAGIDLELKKVKIRNVESSGMLCSERELELSDEHDGIVELPATVEPGTPFAKAARLDDPVIEIAITPNRPDCLGVRGIARDLAAAGLGELKNGKIAKIKGEYDCPVDVDLRFQEKDTHICPVFAGRMVRGVKNCPSPPWLQQRLQAIGLRPISALVDITNYISYDRARPLHVYDANELNGTIHARMGQEGEELVALDDATYSIDERMCVIADSNGVLGLGGIMGGLATGCNEDTTDVFIEAALFDPVNIAKTGRRLNILSDARYRFERGVDPDFVEDGLELATKMVLDICGGTASKKKVAGRSPGARRKIKFAIDDVKRLTGKEVSEKRVENILGELGFRVKKKAGKRGETHKAVVPGWRPDVHGRADLVEEIIRIVGVDKIPPMALPRTHGVAKPVLTLAQKQVRRARRVLAGRGMVEAVTWSFIPASQATLFGGGDRSLELANPISREMSSMRPSLLPRLAVSSQANRDRLLIDSALFEVGQVYVNDTPEGQFTNASGIRYGNDMIRHWSPLPKEDMLYVVKADTIDLLKTLGINTQQLQVSHGAPEWFHPGRSGVLQLGPKNVLAHFGELHPRTLKAMGVDGRVHGFEVFLNNLPTSRKKYTHTRAAMEISDLQPVKRDFAFVLGSDTPAGDVIKAALGADRKIVENVSLFDVFTGGNLKEGEKSLAIEVTLQPQARTLTDAEIDAIAEKIINAVKKSTGGQIRT